MRRRAIFSFIAACALASCAHQTAPQAAAGVEGMQWIDVEGDDPKLAFGLPNSDVLVLMMTCEAKSGQVALALFGDTGSQVRLRSGRTSARLSAQEGGNALHENVVETALPAAAPVLASFARTGELAIGGSRSATALPRAEPAQASRFVASCR